jgi:hypothetical protein
VARLSRVTRSPAAVALVALAGTLGFVVAHGGSGASQLSSPATHNGGSGATAPAAQPAGGTGNTSSLANTPANTTPRPATFFGAPAALTACDQRTFLGSAQNVAQITGHLGPVLDCGRFTSDSQWIILFSGGIPGASGDSGTTTTVAPFGGYSIATYQCPSSDTACLNPSSTHDFSAFSVFRPPDPGAYFTHSPTLLSIWGDKFVVIPDGDCDRVIFDFAAGGWFQPTYGTTASVDAFKSLMNANYHALRRFASQAMSGSAALSATAPVNPSPGSCPAANG